MEAILTTLGCCIESPQFKQLHSNKVIILSTVFISTMIIIFYFLTHLQTVRRIKLVTVHFMFKSFVCSSEVSTTRGCKVTSAICTLCLPNNNNVHIISYQKPHESLSHVSGNVYIAFKVNFNNYHSVKNECQSQAYSHGLGVYDNTMTCFFKGSILSVKIFTDNMIS